ncbi:MAG: MBOAT family protein [Lachnospiraceae bacterium]|nr:MBOAT family protein [Lachnospiraceae bacterium]
MVFSSFYFLLYFLPLFFISYFLVENKYKNITLLLYSIGFYAFGCFDNLYYVLILIGSLVINYFITVGIEENDVDNNVHSDNSVAKLSGNHPISRSKASYNYRYKKSNKSIRVLLLVVSLILNFGNLFIFKYYNFFIDVVNLINKNITINKLNLILPIGISFYTFQIVSYVIDVYFKKIKAERNFVDFATYVIMFPQLIAGPIVRFKDIVKEIKLDRSVLLKNVYEGLSIFIIGLASKVIIANQLSLVNVDISDVGYDRLCVIAAWGGAISYSMQMYFDFFGYSLMAIGLGKMIGITIPDNFKDPFLSLSVEEYWRRWHITLSTWFRDYLMYPILLSKPIKKIRNAFNKINKKFSSFITTFVAMFIVWAATGLWHGANFNYVIWGLYFFIFMVLEQLIFSKTFLKIKPLAHIYLLIVIIISFVIFSNENLNDMMLYFSKMFGVNATFINETFDMTIMNNVRAIIIGILCVIKIPNTIYMYVKNNVALNIVVMILLLGVSLFLIYLGYNDPFLYFRF